jgi:hypothetical protein
MREEVALYAGIHWHPELPASANYKNSPICPLHGPGSDGEYEMEN